MCGRKKSASSSVKTLKVWDFLQVKKSREISVWVLIKAHSNFVIVASSHIQKSMFFWWDWDLTDGTTCSKQTVINVLHLHVRSLRHMPFPWDAVWMQPQTFDGRYPPCHKNDLLKRTSRYQREKMFFQARWRTHLYSYLRSCARKRLLFLSFWHHIGWYLNTFGACAVCSKLVYLSVPVSLHKTLG